MSEPTPAPNPATENTPVLPYARAAPGSAIAIYLCRLLAIWMLAWGLYQGTYVIGLVISSVFDRYRGPGAVEAAATTIAAIVPVGIWAFFAWYCWTRAPKIAGKMSSGVELGAHSKPISSDELLHVLLVCIGVFLLTDGVPSLGWVLYTVIEHIRQGTTESISYMASTFSGLIRVALGAWLALRPFGAVELIKRYSRPGPQQGPDDPKQETPK